MDENTKYFLFIKADWKDKYTEWLDELMSCAEGCFIIVYDKEGMYGFSITRKDGKLYLLIGDIYEEEITDDCDNFQLSRHMYEDSYSKGRIRHCANRKEWLEECKEAISDEFSYSYCNDEFTNIHLILNFIDKNAGKLVQLPDGDVRLLVCATSSLSDYYYVTMGIDGHFRLTSCCVKLEVIDERIRRGFEPIFDLVENHEEDCFNRLMEIIDSNSEIIISEIRFKH